MRSSSYLPFFLLLACRQPASVVSVALDLDPVLDGPVTVTLDEDLRNPVVEMRVDGVSGRFAVDTGAQVTSLDAAFVARAGLACRSYSGLVNANRADRDALRVERVAEVGRLALGDAVATDVLLQVMDFAHMERGYDGILGMDFLGDWALLFDASRRELHLVPGEPVDHLTELFADGTGFHGFHMKGDGRRPTLGFVSRTGEEETSFEMLVDTGATFSGIPKSLAGTYELEAIARIHDVVGTREREVRRLKSFSLGPFEVSMRATVIDHEVGLLGFEMLKEFVFLVDAPRRQVLLSHRPSRRRLTEDQGEE